jgi:RPA family protein
MYQPAYKLRIEDLVWGEYKRSADGIEPSYFLTPWNDRVVRARVLGTVIDKFIREDKSYGTLRLDDGTGTIQARAWGADVANLDQFNVGDVLDIVGRVREFEGEVYLKPELIIRVEDLNWELVRELEIIKSRREALARGVKPKLPPKLEPRILPVEAPAPKTGLEKPESPPLEVPEDLKDRVFLTLKESGGEEGIHVLEIAEKLKLSTGVVESAVRALLAEGKIFEPEAGKFKLVV